MIYNNYISKIWIHELYEQKCILFLPYFHICCACIHFKIMQNIFFMCLISFELKFSEPIKIFILIFKSINFDILSKTKKLQAFFAEYDMRNL